MRIDRDLAPRRTVFGAERLLGKLAKLHPSMCETLKVKVSTANGVTALLAVFRQFDRLSIAITIVHP